MFCVTVDLPPEAGFINLDTVISVVAIYPKRIDRNNSKGEYHLITFKTMEELNRGDPQGID